MTAITNTDTYPQQHELLLSRLKQLGTKSYSKPNETLSVVQGGFQYGTLLKLGIHFQRI